MVERWHLDNGREGKKEVEDYGKKVKTVMVNNSININHHSLKRKKGRQHHLMLEMQVMAWDRING